MGTGRGLLRARVGRGAGGGGPLDRGGHTRLAVLGEGVALVRGGRELLPQRARVAAELVGLAVELEHAFFQVVLFLGGRKE